MDDVDDDYETLQPNSTTYGDYLEPVGHYESVDERSSPRDSGYEQLPSPDVPPTTPHYTALNGLTTATATSPLPDYHEPGTFSSLT